MNKWNTFIEDENENSNFKNLKNKNHKVKEISTITFERKIIIAKMKKTTIFLLIKNKMMKYFMI